MVTRRSLRVAIGVMVGLFLLLIVPTTSAAPYGRGAYGDCTFNTNCVEEPTTTETTLPSGLKVAVNLVNGQTIPRQGYEIVVTPLNGQGSSFDKVEFYIDDQLAHSMAPDSTGTARWFWDPAAHPGTRIRIVVTDGTETTTQHFTVKLATATPPAPQPPATPTPSGGFPAAISTIYKAAENLIKSLPAPIVYSLPYLLFVILGINAGMLLLQAKRELSEYRTLQGILARTKAMGEAKKTLLELVSHYLRTPLTLIVGGIDMTSTDKTITLPVPALQAATKAMGTHIESLIAHVREADTAVVSWQQPVARSVAFWRQPGLFLPVLFIGVIAFSFTYLAQHAGTFSISQANVLIQIAIFATLVLTTYQIFRRLQLRKRDTIKIQQLTAQAAAAGKARDSFITESVSLLSGSLRTLEATTVTLPPSKSTEFIRDGQRRFRDVLAKFAVAAKLPGSHSILNPESLTVSSLASQVLRQLQPQADKRHITISVTADATLSVREPELVAFVLYSLLDNAIAYSPDNSHIEISGQRLADGTSSLTVTDHGSGIPADTLPLLFQPFSKAEGAEVFTHEGMGFSLYLDKLIMTYLGGTIDITSIPHETTHATITFPSPVVAT